MSRLYYRTHPEEPTEQVRKRLGRTTQVLVDSLLGAREEIRHADIDWAAHFAVHLVAAACREKILFDDYPLPDDSRANDERLLEELTRMALGYLRGPV